MRLEVAMSVLTLALVSTGAARAEVEWSPVTGRFTARYMGYNGDSPREDSKNFGEGELRLQIAGRLGKNVQLVAVPLLQYNTAGRTENQFRLHEEGIERPLGTFEELHLTYYGKSFEVSIGKQLFSWGAATGFKPTDDLNAADFLDVPTLHKLGVPAISFLRSGKVDVQLVVEPLFTPHRLPQPDNRWTILPEDIIRKIVDVSGVEPLILVHRNLPVHDLDHVQSGLRLRSSSLVSGWDLELSVFHGNDPFGLISAELLFPPVRIEAEVTYPEYTDFGGGFSTAAGRFTVHGEVAYHRTSGDIDDDYWQYVAGFDCTVDQGIGALDRIQLGLEYIGESIDNKNKRPPSTFPTGFDRGLTNSALGAIDLVFSENTKLRLGGAINFDRDDFTTRAQITHKPVQSLEIQAGVDIFSGPPKSFYGNWQENDRFFFFTNVYF